MFLRGPSCADGQLRYAESGALVAEEPAPVFGKLLRQLRAEARLTQEELAEAASIGVRTVSDLERSISLTARRDTARLLAAALGLTGPERALFEAAARGATVPSRPADGDVPGSEPAGGPAAAVRMLPRDISGFTGRADELARLLATTVSADPGSAVRIYAVGGMAGIGKTTLAVHAAHQLAPTFTDGQFFLALHGHAPGERPVDPSDALASLLLAAGVPATQIPSDLDARSGFWRNWLAGRKVLLVLDDAEGHAQVRPLLPGTAGSVVLITSRRRLTALEDAAVISLATLPPRDAAELLARLADRPGVEPGEASVTQIIQLCGHLPLAIGMLARQLHHHPAWTPAILAADLTAARERLDLMHAENLSVTAALDLSYRNLSARQRRLFRRLGMHPGAEVDVYAAAALDDTDSGVTRRGLQHLYDQHLIAEPAPGRYRMHDLVREYARHLAAADEPTTRQAATDRLLDYCLHTAQAASKHIPARNLAVGPHLVTSAPASAPRVSTREQAVAWLETERTNLHAAASRAAEAGRHAHAADIPAHMAGFLETAGHWDQGLALHHLALDAARQAGDRPRQARSLSLVAAMYAMTGDSAAAIANFGEALELYREVGDRTGQADALTGLGAARAYAGNYQAAAACHREALKLFQDISHRQGQGSALVELGVVQWLTGDYVGSAASHQRALQIFSDLSYRPGQGDAHAHLGAVHRLTGDYPAAAASLLRALELFGLEGDRHRHARTRLGLAMVQLETGDCPAALASGQQALSQLRELGSGVAQADALSVVGMVQLQTGDHTASRASLRAALQLYRGKDQGGEAEVLNSLGELSSRTAKPQQARRYHRKALVLARHIGLPLQEARALEGLGRSRFLDGSAPEASELLHQALAIYQRIGAAAAGRVQQTIRRHDATDTISIPVAKP